MYQPYWVCGSKGYLVHTAHIPPAVEWKIAYMAKFGVPLFPQSRASQWQIMILWQFGPCTVCTSHIGSVSPRAIWYAQLIYPLPWNEKLRIWQSFGYPRSHNQGRPCGRLWFYGILDLKLYVPAILGPWVQGVFGTYSSYTGLNVESKARTWPIWDAVIPTNEGVTVADSEFIEAWTLYCLYQPIGFAGLGAIWYIKHIYPLLWN